MKRNVERHYGAFVVNGALVQTDWEYPATASALGWSIRRVQRVGPNVRHLARRPSRHTACAHPYTDGTVQCPDCGVTASDFIRAAGEYLDKLAW